VRKDIGRSRPLTRSSSHRFAKRPASGKIMRRILAKIAGIEPG